MPLPAPVYGSKWIALSKRNVVRSTLFHPHNALIVVIGFIKAFFYVGYNKTSAFNAYCFDVKQYGRYDIFRSDVTQKVCSLLHFKV